MRYICRVGHASTAETLYAQQADAIERALWAAASALEERAALARRMAARPRARPVDVQRYSLQAGDLMQQAVVIRDLLRRKPSAPNQDD